MTCSPKLINLTGSRFGLLQVTGYRSAPENDGVWICQCSCGRTCEKKSTCLRDGRSNNCGCVKRIKGLLHKIFPKEYQSWRSMKNRCTNPGADQYSMYGGAGVTVCMQWSGRTGFVQFLADMGPKPSPQHSIDRIDNAKGYEPQNCRWATAKEQANNRRNNTLLEVDGLTQTLQQWIDQSGACGATIVRRLRHGWPVKKAIFGRAVPSQ